MKTKEILDKQAIRRSLARITYEIIEHNKGVDNIVVVGIKTRGAFLGRRLIKNINDLENKVLEYHELDISNFRDDKPNNAKKITDGFDVTNKKILLVDDVLYKGRTVRAAMDAIMHMGRPSEIQLAVLIDRGHRELPIRADYIGKNIPSSLEETISVKLEEYDNEDGVYISN